MHPFILLRYEAKYAKETIDNDFFTLKYSAEIYCGRLRNLRIVLVIYSMFMLLLTTTLLKVLNLNNKYKSQQGLVLEILIFSSKKNVLILS